MTDRRDGGGGLHPQAIERFARIETLIKTNGRALDDHEKRIRVIEKHSWIRAGFAAGIGGFAGWISKHIS